MSPLRRLALVELAGAHRAAWLLWALPPTGYEAARRAVAAVSPTSSSGSGSGASEVVLDSSAAVARPPSMRLPRSTASSSATLNALTAQSGVSVPLSMWVPPDTVAGERLFESRKGAEAASVRQTTATLERVTRDFIDRHVNSSPLAAVSNDIEDTARPGAGHNNSQSHGVHIRRRVATDSAADPSAASGSATVDSVPRATGARSMIAAQRAFAALFELAMGFLLPPHVGISHEPRPSRFVFPSEGTGAAQPDAPTGRHPLSSPSAGAGTAASTSSSQEAIGACVDQSLLELVLALVRGGGWAVVSQPFLDHLLYCVQVSCCRRHGITCDGGAAQA